MCIVDGLAEQNDVMKIPEARKRFTACALETPETLFYANRFSFFLVSRCAREESTLTPRVAFITISQVQSVPRD